VLEGKILDYLLHVDMGVVNRLGMFAVTLSEPFSCVEKSYNLEYRKGIKENGIVLLAFVGPDKGIYEITKMIEESRPNKIFVTNISSTEAEPLQAYAKRKKIELVSFDSVENIIKMAKMRITVGLDSSLRKFDDIIIFGDESEGVSQAANQAIGHLAKDGILNIIGDIPKGTQIPIDIGSIHYDDTHIEGTTGPDISAARSGTPGQSDSLYSKTSYMDVK